MGRREEDGRGKWKEGICWKILEVRRLRSCCCVVELKMVAVWLGLGVVAVWVELRMVAVIQQYT